MKLRTHNTHSLSLTENDVHWLKGLMQNPINCVSLDVEEPYDKDMRHKFWVALGGNVTSNVVEVSREEAEKLFNRELMQNEIKVEKV